jgi:hypothetical protein
MTHSTSSSTGRQRTRVGWRRWQAVGLTALTAYSAALGWQAQLVSYPLFKAVSSDDFADYHSRYNAAIPVVVIVPGFLTFVAGAAFYWTRPLDVPRPAAALVGAAGVTSLLSTVLWAIPMHDRLDEVGQSIETIDSLLQSNMLRSLALTVGAVTLAWCVAKSGRGSGAAHDMTTRDLTRTRASRTGHHS